MHLGPFAICELPIVCSQLANLSTGSLHGEHKANLPGSRSGLLCRDRYEREGCSKIAKQLGDLDHL